MSPAARLHGTEIAYELEGAGPDIVLLHAGIADLRMWQAQAERFAAAGFRVLRYDRRGFGGSPLPGGTYSALQDHLALLGSLGIDSAVHVGVSAGGALALDVALHEPTLVDALVLVAPPLDDHDWSSEMEAADAAEEQAFEEGDKAAVVEADLRTWVAGPERSVDEIDAEIVALARTMMEDSFDLQWPAYSSADPPTTSTPLDPPASARLGELRMPVLVICGDRDMPDMQAIALRLAREIEGAQHVVMHGVAHLPNLEDPAMFDEIVLRFLARARQRP